MQHKLTGTCLHCAAGLSYFPSQPRRFCSQRCYDAYRAKRHPEIFAARQRRWREKLKAQMIAAYGGHCVCCGESHEAFLTIDHIGGRTKANHPWTRKAGTHIYAKLKALGWPKDKYRLLCMNCNFAIRYGGICPHQYWPSSPLHALA